MSGVNPWVALATNLILPRLNDQSEKVLDGMPEVGEVPEILRLRSKQGAVVLLLGRRESGKTTLAYRLAELLGRPIYAISPEQKPPDGVTPVKMADLEFTPPPFSTLIIDDAPVVMGSRDYSDAYVQQLEKIIPVVRHTRKLILIFCSQLASLSDKYTMDCDVLFLKPPSLLYADIERPYVKRWFDKVGPQWEGKGETWIHKHAYVLTHTWEGMIRVDKAKFN